MLSEKLKESELRPGEHLVVEERGGLVEALHRAHVAVVDTTGRVVKFSGDPNHVTYTRSCIKPIQALPVLFLGSAERYGFSDQEVAMIMASHSGEELHLDLIRSIMKKANVNIDQLGCSGHAPFHKEMAKKLRGNYTKLHDNCSGKHAGAIALCTHMGWDIDNYMDFGHPLNLEIMKTISKMCGISIDEIHLGKDGCDIPNYGIPICKMAQLFARLCHPEGLPWKEHAQRARDVFISNPHLIAGSDRFDTTLMKEHPGILLSKAGAAGLQTMALKTDNSWLGISIKIEDGSYPPVETLSCHVLKELGIQPGVECKKRYYPRKIKTRSKTEAGSIYSIGSLRDY